MAHFEGSQKFRDVLEESYGPTNLMSEV